MKKFHNNLIDEIVARSHVKPETPSTVTSYELYDGLIHDESNPSYKEIRSFLFAVLTHGAMTRTMPLLPSDIAKITGGEGITFSEYVSALKASGIDTDNLHRMAIERDAEFEKSRHDAKVRAANFFEIIKTDWMISDEQVRELIDSESILDLLELVLMHANSTRARLKAIKRHANDYAMKDKVFVWCDENMTRFKSMDAAAFDIAETFVPNKFRTVRDWMTEWKKLRSASKL